MIGHVVQFLPQPEGLKSLTWYTLEFYSTLGMGLQYNVRFEGSHGGYTQGKWFAVTPRQQFFSFIMPLLLLDPFQSKPFYSTLLHLFREDNTSTYCVNCTFAMIRVVTINL